MPLETHSPESSRVNEVCRYLDKYRGRLRPLAESRCWDDFRLVAATFRLRDGFWLWTRGERRAPSQVRDDAYEGHYARYTDAVIEGVEPDEAEKLLWDDDGSEVVRSDTWPASAIWIGEPVEAYRSSTIEQVREIPDGLFGSCIKCRQTFGIDYVQMRIVTGEAIVKRARRPLAVPLFMDWPSPCTPPGNPPLVLDPGRRVTRPTT
jgi:hypothetical protein